MEVEAQVSGRSARFSEGSSRQRGQLVAVQVEPGEGGEVPQRFWQRGQLVAVQVERGEGGEVPYRFRQRGQLVAGQVKPGEGGEVPDRFRAAQSAGYGPGQAW